jgi:hypothetical protein
MDRMVEPPASWHALTARGLSQLSPPEAEHAVLELATNRVEYVGMLQDICDYPRRSPLDCRVPQLAEIEALDRRAGLWRSVSLLDDERALCLTATLFSSALILDPFYDTGALLYAAWHDSRIRADHARHLADQAGLLVRAGPLLESATALLAPDHLPGSWNPRRDWRKPPADADDRQRLAWALRTSLALLYWADRLDGVICTSRSDVIAALACVVGEDRAAMPVELVEPVHVTDARASRDRATSSTRDQAWKTAWRASRQRRETALGDVASVLATLSAHAALPASVSTWQLSLGDDAIPEPALMLRRVLLGQDARHQPPLPRRRLRRRPMLLLPLQNSQEAVNRARLAPSHTPANPSRLVPSM